MAISTGINKRVTYKAETTFGTAAGSSGGQVLRRVTSAFNLEKETYQSGEIRTDYQVQDMRHGVRTATGSVSGELSPGSYADFLAAAVARDFVAGVSAASVSYTVAASGNYWTVTRAAGSYLTDGFKIGDVIRITAAGGNAANTGKNLLILTLTATVATVAPLNDAALVAEGPIASATIAVQGKKTFAPITGHTDKSFTVEEWYSDISQSEVFTGLKVNTASLSIPATGLVTCDFGFMGKDLAQTGSSAYFSAPTAQTSTGIFAAVNGALVVNGTPVALVTDASINLNRNLQNATVVGSNSIADIFEGRITVDGSFSAYFQDATFRDLFNNETEVSLVIAITTSNDKGADFMSIVLPRIKVNSNTKADGESGIVASHNFVALLNSTGGTGAATEKTTISFQDSAA